MVRIQPSPAICQILLVHHKDANEHPSVTNALEELGSNDYLRRTLEGLLGSDPSIVEITGASFYFIRLLMLLSLRYRTSIHFPHPDPHSLTLATISIFL